MKRMLPKPLRPYAPAIGMTIAGAVVAFSVLAPIPMMIIGALLASAVSFAVTIEYLVLVPLRRNPGAKRLLFLLTAVDLLLLVSILRYFFKDYPFRTELLTILFWFLFLSLVYLGWHMWMDQLEGAKAYLRNRDKEQAGREQ